MYAFGKTSSKRLATVHEDLQRLMLEAISTSPLDFTIICGHRSKREQDEAFRNKASLVKFPHSRHNVFPSCAVDIAPWHNQSPHIRWRNLDEFKQLAKHIKKTAKKLKIEIEWGGDWETFKDYPHFQIKES